MTVSAAAQKKAKAIRAFKKAERPEAGVFDRFNDVDVSIGVHRVIAADKPLKRVVDLAIGVVRGFHRRVG